MRVTSKIALGLALILLVVSGAQGALVGYWAFDEASSGSGAGVANDSAGYVPGSPFNGTISGAQYTTGRNGLGALTFDGVDDYVNVGIQTPLALTGSNYTFAWWVKWGGTTGQFQRMINMDDATDYTGGYSLLLTGGGGLFLSHNNGNDDNVSTSAAATAGIWQHVAVVFNGTNREVFLNGISQGTYATTGGGVANDGNDPLWFGGLTWTSPPSIQHFKGAMDEIRIYNEALSSTKVLELASVPEPAGLILLASGGLALLLAVLRRRRAS